MDRVGVLLLNLGGPEQLEDVRPFLFNLFSDPEIIRLPVPWLQRPLAWFISQVRSGKSKKNYEQIGGGSPLRRITEAQGKALERRLAEIGHNAKIYVGMRYWHPFIEEVMNHIKQDGIEHLVIFPLYPQFSISTSGSSFRVLEKMWQADSDLARINYTLIPSWYDHPDYLKAMADLITQELDKHENSCHTHIFFSAHGVPKSYVDKAGDPYQVEIEACTHLIMKTLNRPNDFTLAYQSRVGPVEWLRPYTEDSLKELGKKGVKDLLVVPVSFVSEHIETLQEIDIEYREVAKRAGIENFYRVPALNTHPIFIDSLAQLVTKSLQESPYTFDKVIRPKENRIICSQEYWRRSITTTIEVWNTRLAIIGFIALLFELISGHGLLHLAGLL
ncbi:ferrochelatase [Cyanobacterium sp. uoEpiScrs1]|uniref:ferrochelatase n=1 Tax=Cyanobacterium sp. uoEpiScrs1 TaxID=2976343 RepID=UPI00226A10D4|nr:ferrochelatase [Cyanobacterium sp. uoEpiScrs1]